MISRRAFLAVTAAGTASAIGLTIGLKPLSAMTAAGAPQVGVRQKKLPAGVPADMVVYKDPECGCCTEWIKHVEAAGFTAKVLDTSDLTSVKKSMGIPATLYSCHTARVGSYLVEGHVPADLIVRMLTEKKTDMRGIAVPGMPVGSPGMEMGNRKDRYDVIAFDKAGKGRVYASR